MSNELKQFYRELLSWIHDGCLQHAVFSTDAGLCSTIIRWSDFNEELYREQKELLIRHTGNSTYPFNSSAEDFAKEHRDGSFYQNPKRLAFIEEHAK